MPPNFRFKELIINSKKLQKRLFLDVSVNNIQEATCQSEKLPYRNISITKKPTYIQDIESIRKF